MPELPEVETIRRELKCRITGKRINGCRILRKDIIGYPGPDEFCRGIIDKRILDVSRRAKYLIITLENDKRLIFHLRLSGSLSIIDSAKTDKRNPEELKFARLIIELEDESLVFCEPRVLGRVYLIKNDERPKGLKGFFNLSYEPLSPEYDFLYFKEKIKKRKAKIKSVLLDQMTCAGVGNIYADEALFHANIRPIRRANTLKTEEIFKLLMAIKRVLKKGIEECGTTVSDYRRINGRKGNFQNFLYVYNREGKPCKKCGRMITLTKVGNRSTRYCPGCQK